MPRETKKLKIGGISGKGVPTEVVTKIVKNIIGPIYRNAFGPEGLLTMAVDNFFRMGRRDVYFARTTERCQLPGVHLNEGGKQIPGMPRPKLPKNKLLIIVQDDDDAFVKVEVALKDKDLNVLMTQAEFNYLKQHIRRI
jgi:hypothetical protein